jgi:hypothetical protein
MNCLGGDCSLSLRRGSNGSTGSQSCQSQISPQVALEVGPLRQVSNSPHGVNGNGHCRSEGIKLTWLFDCSIGLDLADAPLSVRDIGSDDACALAAKRAERNAPRGSPGTLTMRRKRFVKFWYSGLVGFVAHGAIIAQSKKRANDENAGK